MDRQKEFVDALQAIPWFQELSDEHIILMCKITHLVNLLSGINLANRKLNNLGYKYSRIKSFV